MSPSAPAAAALSKRSGPMLGGQMSTPRRPTGGNSRVNESSDTSDKPVKPQDYAGLRAETAELVDDFRYR